MSERPDPEARADFLRALVWIRSLIEAGIPTAMFGPYRRTAPGKPPFYRAPGMADESVDLRDVATTAASIYARLVIDLLG
jgi:hypothetical protein